MSDISTKESELRREYKQQSKWIHFDTWLVVRIAELEARIELALWLTANPCTPGFVGEALRGRKLDEMPETVQAMIKEDMEQSDE